MKAQVMIRLMFATTLFAAVPALAQQSTLKPGPDRDTVDAACSVCHTTNYIRMNAPFLTPDAWKAEVTKMQKIFGAPIDDDAVASILRYLNATYAAPPKP